MATGGISGVEDRDALLARVRRVVGSCAQVALDVAALEADASLYDAGMSSRASVAVMIALEAEFDLEFPDELLNRNVFESIASIAAAIEKIRAGG
jgi:acyl carrier protein